MAYIGSGISRFNTADELTVTGDAIIDTTTLVVDSTNNRVGIGTATPAANRALHVSSTAQNHARFERTGSATSQIEFQDSTTTNQPSLGGDGDNLTFRTSFTERMRITSAGSVGIGTAPAGGVQLDVRGTGVLQLVNTDTVQLLASNGGSTLKNVSNNPLIFGTNNTERMRLDASGNLLVGTTDSAGGTSGTTEGIALSAGSYGGFIGATRSGDKVASFNRTTSDGTIVDFRKNGTTVGSIGALSGNFYVAGSAKGLRVGSSSVVPATNTGSDSDNAIDLGYASSRFKDLYLSGGVYLGGTGSANELSDYEEGTFTPNLVGDSGEATYTGRHGTYTKIGRVVTVNIMMDISSVNTISGTVFINTLPFAVASVLDNTSLEASGIVGFFTGLNTSISCLSCFAFEGTVNAGFYKVTGTSSTSMSILTASDITNSFDFRASLTYFTNA